MVEKGFSMCKHFIGGSWSRISKKDFCIKTITGGLSNLLYQCSVSDKVETGEGEPRMVLLRIYGQIIQENTETVVTDSVVFALLAEKNMGPKLFGVFTGGRVEEYVPSRHLYTRELSDPEMSRQCATVMARFHKLHMPLYKEPRWLFDIMTRYLDDALNNLTLSHANDVERAQLQKLISFNLAEEFQTLKFILSQVESAVVFCHNDFQEGNLLVPNSPHKIQTGDIKIIPIDFEYSNYNFRGFDLGNHFCEWCYDYSVDEDPYYSAVIDNYPDREQQLNFVRSYLKEYPEDGQDVCQLEEHLLLEANTYALASHMMWGLWSIVQWQISTIKFKYLDYALVRFEHYFFQKARLPSHLQTKRKV
ncbi:hypothetical protein CAPTEDRAFT_173503 [Capitella teleta]|uniref:Choline kinase N-terminal domain-containing protein n=1 Tax=Capitella teleta TaxID=283909 RepID=R7U580_CAPTE|nr:hypothetical protein CAPTEDRAFT_173503 [Capitella teleta]|eukprot:ELU01520.1 hypothetical protein CAPTEDRAFT_173503 [Capitella teleta]